jgi:hypothetical protein
MTLQNWRYLYPGKLYKPRILRYFVPITTDQCLAVLNAAATFYARFLLRLLSKLLLLCLRVESLTSRAEGLYPQLSQAALNGLRSRLPAGRPNTNQVVLLGRLG